MATDSSNDVSVAVAKREHIISNGNRSFPAANGAERGSLVNERLSNRFAQ
jgi:hypothetical protein